HAAETKLIEKFFDDAFQVVDVEFRFAFAAAPEERIALAGDGNGDAAFFLHPALPCRRDAGRALEDAADFEQGDVVVFSTDVVTERVNQSRQQARTEDIHVGTQRVCESYQTFAWRPGFGIADERLALGFIQAKTGEDAAGFGDLVVDGIVGIRADGAARRSGGDFFDAVESSDFFDQIHVAFQVDAEGGDLEGRSRAFRTGDGGFIEQGRGVRMRLNQRDVRGARTNGLQAEIFQEANL